LTDDDIGWTRSIEGYIQGVELGEKRVVLLLQNGNYTAKVFFEEFFFDNAPVNFSRYFERLESLVQKHKKFIFSGVGLIEKRNDQYAVLVNRGNDFRIDYQYIAVFLDNASA